MAVGCGGAPSRASILIGCISWVSLLASASDECLAGAVPPERRANITVDGVSMPVGVVHLEWDSARLASQVYAILAEEILGYNTFRSTGAGQIESQYRLMGCANPTDVQDPQCDDAVPGSDQGFHVVLELWHGGNSYELDRIDSEFPAIAPANLGSIGYSGNEGMYILAGPRQQALSIEGLALEYYRTYNASWYQVSQYFPLGVSDVDTSKLKRCSEVHYLNDHSIWEKYLFYTGDVDGVVIDGEGIHRARCWDEVFWLAPACRADPSTCILVITTVPGWGLEAFPQKAAVYTMPMAFATTATWDDYLSLPRDHGTALYWWTPDISFVDLSPSRVVFPDNSEAEWMAGDRKTASQQVMLSKHFFKGFDILAPRLANLAASFHLELSVMDAMLADKGASGDSYRAVACRWLQANGEVWEQWIQDETSCTVGMGLVNESDAYVHDRNLASSCSPCMPGKFSEKLVDRHGVTRVCSPCAPGSYQNDPLTESCLLCSPGKLSQEWGQEQCKACPKMYFQANYNSTVCEPCPPPMTTEVLGAMSLSQCICPWGTYKPLASDGGLVCKDCPVGMSCAEGSDEANLPSSAAGVSSDVVYPRIDSGYYAKFESPMSVYRCRDEVACPGTDFERCAENMEGIACGRCKSGYYHSGDVCKRCNDVETLQILFPTIAVVLGPVAVYGVHRVSRDPFETWGSPMHSLQTVFYVALVYVQMVGSMNTMYIFLPATYEGSVGWTSITYDLMSSLRPECAVLDFATGFAIKLFLPAYVAVIFLLTYGASKILELWKPALHLDRDIVFNNFMAVFYTFFVGIAAQTISLWQCYDHPNATRSLVSAPDVFCYEETWTSLVAVSVIAALLFCVGPFMLFSWAIFVAPSRFHEESFRERWKFLFVKFRPDVYWWGIVLLTRGLWVPFTTVVFDVGARQIIWMSSMILAYVLYSFAILPWRSFTVAGLDVVVHASLLFLFTLLPHFALPGEMSDEELAVSALAVSCIPLGCAGVCVVYISSKLIGRTWYKGRSSSSDSLETLAHIQEMCEVFDKLDPAALSKVWRIIPAADRRLLVGSQNVIESEVFHTPSAHRLSVRMACAEVLGNGPPPADRDAPTAIGRLDAGELQCSPVCPSVSAPGRSQA